MENTMYHLREHADGTLILEIPQGVCSTEDLFAKIRTDGWGWFSISQELRQSLGKNDWETFGKISVLSIPASMETVEDRLFWHLQNLKEIRVHPDNPYFLVEDGALYSKDKKRIVRCFEKEGRHTFYIDESVEEIAESCFSRVKGLSRIHIGGNVKKIGDCGLWGDGCELLERIYIPPTVTELKGEIFDSGGDAAGMYYPVSVVGGASGSAIEEYCNIRGISFLAVEEMGIEDFYAAPLPALYQRIKEMDEQEFRITDLENGYRADFSDGVLTFCGIFAGKVTLEYTRTKISAGRREKVKKVVVGPGITEIADLAFDDYENLESVYIGADVQNISPMGFSGRNQSSSLGCPKISTIAVDEKNLWYCAIDNVLYTRDMQTLVKYSPCKPELYHEVDPRVRHIGSFAFEHANALQCLKVGGNCVSVGHAAFLNVQNLRHAWFAESVTSWPKYYPFGGEFGFDRPWYISGLIIGGPRGSTIEKYCAAEGVRFYAIEESKIRDFLKTPSPEGKEDPYMAACLKKMIVDRDGTVQQLGVYDEELVFPEGATATHYRINLSGCKKVMIPATMQWLWTEGFDGPAPELGAFVVAGENETYKSVDGHLYKTDGTLLTYAPAADHYGVLPEATVAIDKNAFRLLPAAFEKICIPSGVKYIETGWQEWFFEAEVATDNPVYRSVAGSIFSADGERLICAKISLDGFHVPAGTVVICQQALCSVHGTVCIPGSVTKIEDMCGLGRHVTAIRAPEGSYAEQYAKEHHIPLELE